MEEAKIKAFRVQITDLETAEKEVDEITTAVLCSTLTNSTSDGGTYNCVMRCKEGLPAVSRYGLFKSCEKQMYKWFATVFVEAVKSGYRGVMKDFFEKMFNEFKEEDEE